MRDRADMATLSARVVPVLAPGLAKRARRSVVRHVAFPLLSPLLAASEFLPRSATAALWERLFLGVRHLAPALRRRAERNIAATLGTRLAPADVALLSRECFRSLGRAAADVPRLRRVSRGDLLGLVRMTGFEHVERALAAGRGVVAVAPHVGNWEVLACYLAARGVPIAAAAADVYDPRLGEYLAAVRKRWGVTTIVRGEAGASRRAITTLRRGEMLGTLIDLRTRRDGVRAPFLGRDTNVPAGPIRLALRAAAPIVPIWIHLAYDGRYVAEALEPIQLPRSGDPERDLHGGVRRVLAILGEFVRRCPEQWLWMHDQWPSLSEA
jgi:KDO2-lipid IV(A) lauroyltransferase